jgi:FMN phosphatase YigB (HAD superfamily)
MTDTRLTVLFDLDDTLLSNDMDVFFPFYLKTLSQHMDVAPLDQLASILMAGTKQMMVKTLPAETLEETFDKTFYPGLGIDKDSVRDRVDEFYSIGFNQLTHHTALRPEARSVVEHCFTKGYQTVIATNPLMPLQANLNRLRWANVPADDFPYTLITSYETSHFCKPHPAYYAEILGRLGWKQEPVVMIGNSRDDDIVPSLQLGIPAFWLIYESEMPNATEIPANCTTGRFNQIPAWLDEIAANHTTPKPVTPEGLLAVLQSTPAVLATFVKSFSSKKEELLASLHQLIAAETSVNIPEFSAVIGQVPDESHAESSKRNGSIFETLEQFVSMRTTLLTQILPHRQNWTGALEEQKNEQDLISCMRRIAQNDQQTIRSLYSTFET